MRWVAWYVNDGQDNSKKTIKGSKERRDEEVSLCKWASGT